MRGSRSRPIRRSHPSQGEGRRQRRNRRADEGTNSYHWVFHCKDAVVHQPDYSRGARVVEETMGGHQPEVWISDRYSAQQSMAQHIKPVWRIWRATRPLRWSMARTICRCGSSCGSARRSIWPRTSPTSLPRPSPAKKRVLENQLAAILGAATECDLARQLQAKIGRARDQLLTFCDHPGEVEPPIMAQSESCGPA